MADKTKVLAPGFLRPGDMLLYHPVPGIGALISWGEWSGEPGEALEYCHAGIVVDPLRDLGFEQNPPASHWTKLSEEDWARIDVWRLKPEFSVDPQKLTQWCNDHLNIDYPYEKYFRFIEAAIAARAGDISLAQQVDSAGKLSNPQWEVCSAMAVNAVESASAAVWPKLAEDERPADVPLGPIEKIPNQA